jgi:hypothetical protein
MYLQKSQIYTFAALAGNVLLSLPLLAHAILLPSISVENLKLGSSTFESAGTVTGTFSIANHSTSVQNDLGYSIRLSTADGMQLLSSQVYPKHLSLQPVTSENETFSYALPASLSAGEYVLQIRIINGQGIELGWQNISFTVTSNAAASDSGGYITIKNALIIDSEKSAVRPLSGPTFAPGTSPTVIFTAENTGSAAVTASIQTIVYLRSQQGEQVTATTSSRITIPANDSKEITLDLPAQEKAESYLAQVALVDSSGHTLSAYAFFRWVIAGPSGKIQNISVPAPQRGGYCAKLPVQILYSGPADGAVLKNLRLIVTAKSADGAVVGTQDLALSDSQGNAEISIPLSKCVGAVTVAADLKAGDAVIDSYSVDVAAPPQLRAGLFSTPGMYGAAALALLIAAVAGSMFLRRRGQNTL